MGKNTVVTYVKANGSQAKTTVTDQQLRQLKASGRLVANHGTGSNSTTGRVTGR